ncbi:hypothetical protein Q6273_28235, partial [Klebsiella pneumoniae]|nr:hypothetical protein [Klebsiella pneumoniae]
MAEVERIASAYLDIPIIMLTAKGEEDNKIQGLEVGADDYAYEHCLLVKNWTVVIGGMLPFWLQRTKIAL